LGLPSFGGSFASYNQCEQDKHLDVTKKENFSEEAMKRTALSDFTTPGKTLY